MAGGFRDIIGTSFASFRLGLGATSLAIKNASSKIRARNAADSADVPLVGSVIAASGDQMQLNEDAAGSGADWLMTLNRPATGMTHALNLTLPSGDPAVGQAVTVASFAGDNIAFQYTTIAAGTDKTVVDTTAIAFGAASPISMFTLPANAIITEVRVIVTTAFNGTPSLSIGITGTLSKYMSATANDLNATNVTVPASYFAHPELDSVGTTEALIATYAAGGATVGAGRILVSYVIPS